MRSWYGIVSHTGIIAILAIISILAIIPPRYHFLTRSHLHLSSHLILLPLAEAPTSIIRQPVLQLVLRPIVELFVGGTQPPCD